MHLYKQKSWWRLVLVFDSRNHCWIQVYRLNARTDGLKRFWSVKLPSKYFWKREIGSWRVYVLQTDYLLFLYFFRNYLCTFDYFFLRQRATSTETIKCCMIGTKLQWYSFWKKVLFYIIGRQSTFTLSLQMLNLYLHNFFFRLKQMNDSPL